MQEEKNLGGQDEANKADEAKAKETSEAGCAQEQRRQADRPDNVVTRFYDRANVSVRTLNIAIVLLCALILLLALFGNQIHLGF